MKTKPLRLKRIILIPLFFLLIVVFFSLTSCSEIQSENKVPYPEELYVFPFKSEVDALKIGCGYTDFEKCSDDIKKSVRKETPPLSTNDLIQLGELIHHNLIPKLTEHEKSIWAKEIVEKMKPHLVEKEFPYNVYTVNSTEFNAFTIPGGNIYVTTGLLDVVRSPEELAFILGHELGHNENDHTKELARLYIYAEKLKKDYGFLGSIAAFITNWTSNSCGKADELECDISSVYLLYKAGYDPEKALGGVALLKAHSNPKTNNTWDQIWWQIFATHPWSEDREVCVRNYVHNAKVKVECEEVFSDLNGFVATKTSPLNLREYPVKNSVSIIKIPKGANVEMICDCIEQEYRKHEGWLYVEYQTDNNIYRGWVDKKYIRPINEE